MWEYCQVTEWTSQIDALMLQLNALGSIGWQAVGITAADPTIGLNSYTVILKRPAAGWTEPADLTAAWCPDPTGRHVQRYWDGLRWTQHATDTSGVQVVDWPTGTTTS